MLIQLIPSNDYVEGDILPDVELRLIPENCSERFQVAFIEKRLQALHYSTEFVTDSKSQEEGFSITLSRGVDMSGIIYELNRPGSVNSKTENKKVPNFVHQLWTNVKWAFTIK